MECFGFNVSLAVAVSPLSMFPPCFLGPTQQHPNNTPTTTQQQHNNNTTTTHLSNSNETISNQTRNHGREMPPVTLTAAIEFSVS